MFRKDILISEKAYWNLIFENLKASVKLKGG
jgi:hypothetical protein